MKFIKLIALPFLIFSSLAYAQYNLGGTWKTSTLVSPTARLWTWISGDTATSRGSYPTFGTKGVAAAANIPAARFGGATWTDANDNLWLYGGSGCDASDACGYLDDLWKYNPSTNQWTWMGGTGSPNAPGTYGSLGVANASNNPGQRMTPASWTDAAGQNLYLMGGWNANGTGTDLWRYEIATGLWTWVHGDQHDWSNGNYGTIGVTTSADFPSNRTGAGTAVDASGNFWLFGGCVWAGYVACFQDLWKYSPSTNQWTWVWGVNPNITNNTTGVYGTKGVAAPANGPGSRSTRSWIDASGNFWLVAGFGVDGAGGMDALNDVWKFNTSTNQWTWISGSNTVDTPSVLGTPGVPSTSNVMGGRGPEPWAGHNGFEVWQDNLGKIWIFGGYANEPGGYCCDVVASTWKFDPVTTEWTYWNGSDNPAAADWGVYGTKGVESNSNHPSARISIYWTNNAKTKFYIFGGNGLDAKGTRLVNLQDTWRLNPLTQGWTWLHGPSSVYLHDGVYGTKGVPSTSNEPGERHSMVMFTDAADNVYVFGGQFGGWSANGNVNSNYSSLFKFNPLTSQWTFLSGENHDWSIAGVYGTQGVADAGNYPAALTGAAGNVDKNGIFWMYGGEHWTKTNHLWKFDPATTFWTDVSGYANAEWWDYFGVYGTKGVASPTNIPGGRMYAAINSDAQGNIWMFGGYGAGNANSDGYLNDLWKYDTTSNQWTWVSGSDAWFANGVYGTKGTPNASNVPGARAYAAMWVDANGMIYIFGGHGRDSVNAYDDYLNDVWQFNPATGNWTWVNGSSTTAAGGNATVFDTAGLFSATATPGGRAGSASIQRGVGSAYIYGGSGVNSGGTNSTTLGDVWIYDMGSNKWMYVKGTNGPEATVFGTKGVTSGTNLSGSMNLPTGTMDSKLNIWTYGGIGLGYYQEGVSGQLWKFK